MKWNFTINQRAIIENGFSIDIVDAAIFDLIKDFAHSGKCKKSIEDAKVYYWISWKLIIEQAPILGLKTRQSVYNRIEKLAANGLIERHPDNKAQSQSWFSFGANYDKMTGFLLGTPVNENEHPVNETLQPCKQLFTAPVNETLHYTTIKNNNINNTNSSDSENFQKEVPSFVEADRQKAREFAESSKQVSIEELTAQLKADTATIELLCINHKIKPPELKAAIDHFKNYLTITGKQHNRVEFRSHFANWLPKNLDKAKVVVNTPSKPKYKNESVPQYVKDQIAGNYGD